MQRKPSTLRRVLAVVLAVTLLLSVMVFPVAAATPDKNAGDNVSGSLSADRLEGNKGDKVLEPSPNQIVRVSIVLEKPATLAAGYSTVDIADNVSAMNYRAALRADQSKVEKAVEKALGKELDVVWNLTLAANIISANVRYGDIKAIEAVDGVVSVYLERQYSPDVISVGGELEPNMAIAGQTNGTNVAWLEGYTGEGTLIAIIDTGLDTDHQSFDNGAFLAAVNEDGVANLKLTEADVLAAYESGWLNVNASGAKASDLYRDEKVPFGWSYVDRDSDITHDNDTEGEHGSHVAGIAAANRLVDTNGDGVYEDALEAVQMAGNAPDAQLLVMKVFGNRGGAYDSDCVAAIEDAIVLGADAVNLSLGMAIPGFAFPQDEDDPYAGVQELLTSSDTVVVYSAGNAGSWAENTAYGALYSDGVNYQFGGESGSYTNSFTVASVNNNGFIGATAIANGVEFGWTDGSLGATFDTLGSETGKEYKFVMVEPNAAGQDAALVGALGLDENTIYITWRGGTSFFEKGNAGIGAGAAGVLVANNTSGTISMDLTGYNYNKPVASILQSDGLAIWNSVSEKKTANGYQYITGTITVNNVIGGHEYDNGYFSMSDFSSWGTTGDLALKPEISAPGGNIYSVNGAIAGGKAYELMSGTSMAAPQITGMAALVQQYLRESGITLPTNMTVRALTQGLLMAAAQPMVDADGNYYSLLQQGAGLANVGAAVTSPVYITVAGQNDGKVKAELGDDPARTGVYTVEFDIHNLTDTPYTYELNADVFTQLVEDGFMDYSTMDLPFTVTFSGAGVQQPVADLRYDFNKDGTTDKADAQLLLDHIILGTKIEGFSESQLDVDGDFDVDTHDVSVLLSKLNASVVVEDVTHVTATITLDADYAAELDDEKDGSGFYVEAFIFVQPVADEEGVLAPELSIPVLAYYGNWTDSSMFEIGSSEDWYNRTTTGLVGGRYPYSYGGAYTGYNLTVTNALIQGTTLSKNYIVREGSDAGLDMGTLNYFFTPIRNYGNGVVQITDQNGNVLWRSEDLGASYGITYYENAGYWLRPSLSGSLYYNLYDYVYVDWNAAIKNVTPDVSELTVSLILAPEYYAQYGYDWDALTDGDLTNGELGEGAFLSTTLLLDQEPPVIEDIRVIGDDPATRTIEVDLTDNKALADAKLYDESENPSNFTAQVRQIGYERMAASGTSATVTFKGGRVTFGSMTLTPGYLYDAIYRLEVTDNAGNVTTKRFAVGEATFTEIPETVTVSESAVEIVMGSTRQLSAVVGPYNLTDEAKAVTWSSADASIATVDENGVVTAVGKGTTTVTASTVYNGANGAPVTAEVEVTVFTLPIVATGILGDADGYAKFFTWNFEDGTLVYSDAEESEVVYPQALTNYVDGTFLAVDGDGTIYQLDKDGTELKSSAGVYDGLLPYDMDYTDDAGFWWTVQGYLLSEDDPMNPEMYGFNLATYGTFIGLAIDEEMSFDTVYQGSQIHIDRTIYLLNTKNQIIEIYLYNDNQNALISTNETDLTANWVGYGGESYSNMVLGADGNLYASIMTGDTNEVYQLTYWESEDLTEWGYSALYLGDFGDGVWPGLFLSVENKPSDVKYDFNNDYAADAADALALLRAVVRDTDTDYKVEDMDVNGDGKVNTRDVYDLLVLLNADFADAVTAPAAAKMGSIASSVKLEKNSIDPGAGEASTETHTVTVPVKASDVENGLFALEFDENVLTYSTYTTDSDALTYVYAKDGVVRVGFAGLDKLAGETVAEIVFTYEANDEDRTTEITVAVIEEGETYNETPATEKVEVELAGEEIPGYILSGVLTDDNFYVRQFTWNTAEGVKYDKTLSSLYNPVVAANKDANEYYVIDYNYMTEVYDTYSVNKSTGAATKLVDTWADPAEDLVPWDIANGGSDFYGVWGVYGYYIFTDLLMDEPIADQQLSAWNFSSYNYPYFMGVAVAEENWTNSSGVSGTKVVYAIADDGYVWKLMPYETLDGTSASFSRYTYSGMPDLYNDVPWATDDATGTSLVVGNDGALYFSCIDADLEASVVYRLTLEGTKYVAEKIGETDYWVYPALLTDAEFTGAGTNAVVTPAVKAEGVIDAVTVDLSKVDLKYAPMTVKGGLNSVEVTETAKVEADANTVTVPVNVNGTNGDFTVAYDADVLTLKDVKASGVQLSSVNMETAGVVRIGYADADTVNGVFELIFTYDELSYNEELTTTLTVTVAEDGEDKTGAETTVDLVLTKSLSDGLKDADEVEEHWAKDAIEFVLEEGIMKGKEEADGIYFDAEGNMIRAEFWTILARLAGYEPDQTKGENWYDDAHDWVVEHGYSDGSDPEADITREMVVTMLWRFYGEPTYTGSIPSFSDLDEVDNWAFNAVLWAIGNKIIKGDAESATIRPLDSITRAEAATIIARVLEG